MPMGMVNIPPGFGLVTAAVENNLLTAFSCEACGAIVVGPRDARGVARSGAAEADRAHSQGHDVIVGPVIALVVLVLLVAEARRESRTMEWFEFMHPPVTSYVVITAHIERLRVAFDRAAAEVAKLRRHVDTQHPDYEATLT